MSAAAHVTRLPLKSGRTTPDSLQYIVESCRSRKERAIRIGCQVGGGGSGALVLGSAVVGAAPGATVPFGVPVVVTVVIAVVFAGAPVLGAEVLSEDVVFAVPFAGAPVVGAIVLGVDVVFAVPFAGTPVVGAIVLGVDVVFVVLVVFVTFA